MAFLRWIWTGICWLIGLILPVFSTARQSRALGAGLRWTLHILIIVAILVGLHYLNQGWELYRILPGHAPIVRYNWLPILFLLVYAIGWLGLWLWNLLVTEQEYPEYADITEAWEEAVDALARAGIEPRDLPMFLILGRPEGPMSGLFQAAKLQYIVDQTPKRPDAPLHVWATRDAIYVSCEGTSLLGRHATLLAFDSPGGKSEAQTSDDGGSSLEETQMPGKARGPDVQVFEMVRRAENRQLTSPERRRLRGLMRQDRSYAALIKKPDEVARLTPRFEAFCRLLVRDRAPYCAINGMIVLVPFAATESDQDAIDTGDTIKHDLAVTRSVLQVNCAKLAVVCDLESAAGFSEFLSGFQDKQRQQRIGQRFPLVPLLEGRNGKGKDAAEAHRALVEVLAGSICTAVMPGWVYKHFHLETPKQSYHDTLGRNAQLFQFMHQFRERQHRLGLILGHGLAGEGEEPPLLGGCYLAATGPDAAREQSFVAGVFRRLSEEENSVSWTDEALAEEASYQHWIALGQTVLAICIVLGLALLGYWFLGSSNRR
jgi:hypothetical protein